MLLAAALGQAGHFVWLWGRSRQGEPLDAGCQHDFDRHCAAQARWFAVSLLSQPRVFDAYARAGALVRAHAPDFIRLVRLVPRVWLLHSQAAARANRISAAHSSQCVECAVHD